MANCKKYMQMLPREKAKYIGELTHACMNNTKFFLMGQEIIKLAEDKGLFEGVTIMPTNEIKEDIEAIIEKPK